MTDAFSFAAARLFKDTNLSVAATLWPSAAGTLDAWESLDEVDGLDLGDPDEAAAALERHLGELDVKDVMSHVKRVK